MDSFELNCNVFFSKKLRIVYKINADIFFDAMNIYLDYYKWCLWIGSLLKTHLLNNAKDSAESRNIKLLNNT